MKEFPLLEIPLPSLEIVLPEHSLPVSGARPVQPKILATEYSLGKLTMMITAPADSTARLGFQKNGSLRNLKLSSDFVTKNPGGKANISTSITLDGPPDPKHDGPESVELSFPQGQGWQTLEFTLTW